MIKVKLFVLVTERELLWKVKDIIKNMNKKTQAISQMALSDKAIERFLKINVEYKKLIK